MMSSVNNLLKTIAVGAGVCLALFAATITPCAAQDTPVAAPETVITTDAEYARDIAALTSGGRRMGKPSLRAMLRYPGRELPRLFIRYAQPAVRGLLLDNHKGGNSSLALNTTLFRNDSKGMKLIGGVGRTSWGDREARVQFTLKF